MSLYIEFTFPVLLSGEDKTTDKAKSAIQYVTLNFPRPTKKRGVKLAINRYFKEVVRTNIDKELTNNIFDLGLDYMKYVRELAQESLNSVKQEDILSAVVKATERAKERKLKEKG